MDGLQAVVKIKYTVSCKVTIVIITEHVNL